MATTITCNDETTTKRRKCNVIAVPEKFEIDEDDFGALVSVSPMHREGRDGLVGFLIENRIKIKKDDETRRVRALSWNYSRLRRFQSTIPPSTVVLGPDDEIERLDLDEANGMQLPRWIGERNKYRTYEKLHKICNDANECNFNRDADTNFSTHSLRMCMRSLPDEIGNLVCLEILELQYIASLPSSIGNLTNLKSLNLDRTESLHELPDEIGNLTSLEFLRMNESGIASIPRSIGSLANLKSLHLARTKSLCELPDEIGNLKRLETLILSGSSITSLPSSIGGLKHLKSLHLDYTNSLHELPHEIGNLSSLETLRLNTSGIASLPSSFGSLTNLKSLNLDHTFSLHELPHEIGNLTSLETLCLNSSGIASLPGSIGGLANLKSIRLDRTKNLRHLPDEIGNLRSLETLYIFCSKIASLPSSIGSLTNMKVLYCGHIRNCRAIVYSLILNRLRSRICYPLDSNEESFPPPSLWPFIFQKLERTDVDIDYSYASSNKLNHFRDKHLTQSDEIFQLLVDFGGRILMRYERPMFKKRIGSMK